MSDDLRNRVARAIRKAWTENAKPDGSWIDRQMANALADAALAEIFRSDGNEEARWIEACENACPACGGSGHKGDVKPAAPVQRCAECDCDNPPDGCNWIATEPAPVSVREAALQEALFELAEEVGFFLRSFDVGKPFHADRMRDSMNSARAIAEGKDDE